MAAAAVGQGVSSQVAPSGASYGRQLLAITADGIASAATRSLITGTSFGDNLVAVLPSVIGRTIGRMAADGLAGELAPARPVLHSHPAAAPDATNLAAPGLSIALAVGPVPGEGGGQTIFVNASRRGMTDSDFAALAARQAAEAAAEERELAELDAAAAAAAAQTQRLRPVDNNRQARSLWELEEWWVGIQDARRRDPTVYPNDPEIDAGFAADRARLAAIEARVDYETNLLLSTAFIGPKTAFSMIGAIPNLLVTGYDYGSGNISGVDAGLNLIPGSQIYRLERQIFRGAEGTAARTNFNVYEILSEQPISGTTRSAHRASANRGLYRDLQSDPDFARMFDTELNADVLGHMSSGRNLLNPPGTVWHHPVENPNVMQLLRSTEHTNPLIQPTLHPQGIGGYGTYYGN